MKFARVLPCLVMCVVYLTVSPGWAADPRLAPQALVLQRISSLTLNPATVTGGTQVLGTVTLLQPASSGGVMVTFRSGNPAVAAVPPNVVVQPGATAATFVVQTQPVATNPNVVNPNPPAVQISAQIGNAAPVIAQLTVLAPTLVALTLDPASVQGGSGSTGTVTISGPAPAGGLVVALSGKLVTSPPASLPALRQGLTANIVQNPVSVPQQVTVPAGATAAFFSVTTKAVSAATAVQIAAAWGVFVTKTATLTLLPPQLPGLVSLSMSPAMVVGGASSTGTVTLAAPAPSGGLVASLSYTGCFGNVVLPPSVSIPAGGLQANFTVQTQPSYSCPATIIAKDVNSSVSAWLGVEQSNIASLSLSQPSVKGGQTVSGVATANGPAGPGITILSLTSSNPLVAMVPVSVSFPSGATSVTFPISTSAVPAPATVIITVNNATTYNCPNCPGGYGQFPGQAKATLAITP